MASGQVSQYAKIIVLDTASKRVARAASMLRIVARVGASKVIANSASSVSGVVRVGRLHMGHRRRRRLGSATAVQPRTISDADKLKASNRSF